MRFKKLLQDDDAVSPVIGVILMVAITVILAAVIGTFVLGLGDQVSDSAPTASFTFDYTADTGASEGTLGITHDGGDKITNTQLFVKASTDFTANSTTTSSATWGALDSTNGAGGDVTAGTSLTITENDGAGTGDEFDTATVRVTWQSSGGDSTATLGKWSGPSA